jgi:ParB family chromosome partitioning protein
MPHDAAVPVALIRPSPHQARKAFDPDALGTLADDIGGQGLLQRVGVRGPMGDGTYELCWGERRWRAVQLLRWTDIPAQVYPPDFDPLLAAASENLQREQLTPLEEARLVEGLLASGLSIGQTARRCRRGVEWVEGRVKLAGAPQDIQDAVHTRAIPLGVAYALMGIDHEGYRKDLIEQARRLGATVPVAQVWLAEYARDRVQLIRSHEGVAEIIRRAQAVQAMTECSACRLPVPWLEIERLLLCPPCYKGIQEAIVAGEGDAPTANP